MLDIHHALLLTAVFTAVAHGQISVEFLALRREFGEYGLFGACVVRVQTESGPFAAVSNTVARRGVFTGLVLVPRLIAAVWVGVAALGFHRLMTPALLLLTATTFLTHRRCKMGLDGSDALSLIVAAALTTASFYPRGDIAQAAALVFIAAQVVLAYVTAGVLKLASPAWRAGDALAHVLNTNTYGASWTAGLFTRFPRLTWCANWGVVLGEVGFVAVLFVPPSVALGVLVTAGVFHLACGVTMGLNSFVWAFASTYPAVLWVNARLWESAPDLLARLGL